MSGALPLLVAAVLSPAGGWHVGAPGKAANPHATPAAWQRDAAPRHASECSIVVRGLDSRGAMPALTPAEAGAAAPQGRRQTTEVDSRPPVSAARWTARARAPPA